MGIFTGQKCAISGSFKGMTQRDVRARLEAAGAHVTGALSSMTDFLIAGEGSEDKIADARRRGVRTLDAAQLEAALAGEALEGVLAMASDEEPEAVSAREALEGFRALAHEAPSAEVWAEICRLLDACQPALLPLALDYVEGMTQGWPEALALLGNFDDHSWHTELREAPPEWITELIQGQGGPKLGLVRVLNLHGERLTGAMGVQAISCPHLAGVRWLAVGDNKLSGAFFKALRQSATLPALTHLNLNALTLGLAHAHAMMGESSLRPTHLSLSHCVFQEPGVLRAILLSPMMAHLEALDLNGSQRADGSCAIEAATALKDARHAIGIKALEATDLDLDDASAEVMLAAPSLAGLEHLDLSYNDLGATFLQAMAQVPWSGGLRSLKLIANPAIDDAALLALLRDPSMQTLEVLDLSGTGAGDEVARALGQGLLPGLKHLGMVDTRLTHTGARAMFQEGGMPRLTKLEVGCRRQGDGLFLALAQATWLTSLDDLEVSGMPRNARTLRELCLSPVLAPTSYLSIDALHYHPALVEELQAMGDALPDALHELLYY